ncbi:MAG: hypothetical protein K2N18_01725, partial [Clostridia bacterium]|nr:hypothetical protein [Clostridia bacterium]
FFLVALIAFCIIAIVVSVYEELTKDDIVAFVLVSIVSAIISAFCVLILIRQLRFEKNLKLWQEDLVELQAKVLVGLVPDNIMDCHACTLVYKFRYKGQDHEIKGKPIHARFFQEKRIYRHVGEKIPIYYSPKYDQVVFIKEYD